MKKILLLLCIIITFVNIEKVYAKTPEIDTCLVGTWSGSEKDDQVIGMQKSWIQYRYPDGKLVTTFTTTFLGTVDIETETGTWWTKNGKFYEKRDGTRKPDVYTYEVINYHRVIFRAFNLSTPFENENYQFMDTRVEEDKTTDTINITKK